MKIRNTEIKVIKGDLTSFKVEAIVNAANNKLEMGGGVAGAIRRKGGQIIEDEALKKGPIQIGEAAFTQAGSLAAKFVIHAATMGLDHKTDEIKIRNSARNALKIAEDLKIKSIAFPALGCGVGGFPLLASAKIMAQEVYRHLREGDSCLEEVIFCLLNNQAFEIFNQGVIKYLQHLTEVLHYGPFVTVDAIIEVDNKIVIIKRSNPPFGWALPGGFLDYGESLEQAAIREAKEETNLEIKDVLQFHTYSDPSRDPRFHTVGTVFLAKAQGKPQAGDDAADLKLISLDEVDKLDFAFDHKKILLDYIKHKKN